MKLCRTATYWLLTAGAFSASFVIFYLCTANPFPKNQSGLRTATPVDDEAVTMLRMTESFRDLSSEELSGRLLAWAARAPRDCVKWCDAHFIDTLTPEIVAACAQEMWALDGQNLRAIILKLVMSPHQKEFMNAIRIAMEAELNADPKKIFQASNRLSDLNVRFRDLRSESFKRWFELDMSAALRSMEGASDAEALLSSAIIAAGSKGSLDLPALMKYFDSSGRSLPSLLTLAAFGLSSANPSAALDLLGRDEATTYLNWQVKEAIFQNLGKTNFPLLLKELTAMKSGRERNDLIMSLSKGDFAISGRDSEAIAGLLNTASSRGEFLTNRACASPDPLKWITGNLRDPYDIASACRSVMNKEWDSKKEDFIRQVIALPDSNAKSFLLHRIAAAQRTSPN